MALGAVAKALREVADVTRPLNKASRVKPDIFGHGDGLFQCLKAGMAKAPMPKPRKPYVPRQFRLSWGLATSAFLGCRAIFGLWDFADF